MKNAVFCRYGTKEDVGMGDEEERNTRNLD